MANIVYRGAAAPTAANTAANKNAPLTNDEIDKNLFALNVGPTIGTTTISPGTSSTTLAGLTSVTTTRLLAGDGTAASPSIAFASDVSVDTGFYWGGDGYTFFTNNGVKTGEIQPGGHLVTVGNITVGGNLIVNGTTTTINSTTLTVDDINIELGSVASPTDATANGGGITLKGLTDKTIAWNSTNSNWTSNQDWNLVTGKAFEINNVSVLSSTTLGSTVVNSSLTKLGTGAGFVKSDALGNLTVDTSTYSLSSHGHFIGTTAVQASSANQAVTGILSVTGGAASNFTLKTADVASAATGILYIESGDVTAGNASSGAIGINSGNGFGTQSAGSVSIYSGDGGASSTTGGNVSIQGGGSRAATSTGGNVSVRGGSALSTATTAATGGNVFILGGRTYNASGTKAGGNVYIDGGIDGSTASQYVTTAGTVNIGNNASGVGGAGTSAVNIGSTPATTTINGIVKLPTVGTSGFVKLGAGGQLSADTTTYLVGSNTYYIGTTSIALNRASAVQTLTGVSIDGSATSIAAPITTGTGTYDLITATMADNDMFRLRVGAGGADGGWVELATGDNGTEPIYVRQYTGSAPTFTNVARTATLLDASGNTSFPGTLGASNLSGTNTGDQTIGDGALTISTVAAATTNNTVTLALSGAYSANTATARTLDLKVGPALTALATLMTTAGAGFIRRGATADTYSIDTNTYLTAEADTLATVTARGASTSVASTFSGGITGALTGNASSATNAYVGQTTNTVNYDYLLCLAAGVNQNIALKADGSGGPTYNPLRNVLSLDGFASHVWAYPALQLGRDWSISQDAYGYSFAAGCKATSASAWTGTGSFGKAMRFSLDPNAGTFYWYVKPTDTADTTTSISFRTAMSLDISGNLSTNGTISGSNLSGTNTGDETLATIKSKLGITTLSGSNTGDQTLPTTLPASDVYAWAKASTKPSYAMNEISSAPLSATTGTFNGAITSNSIITAGQAGFQSATYADGRNRIWSFANSDGHGLSFFVGAGGYAGADSIGLHFGNATAGGCPFSFAQAGNFVAVGNVTAYGSPSDIRLKENVVKLKDSLNKVSQLNGYNYNYIGKDDTLMGVIAQEVELVAPELIYEFTEVATGILTKAVRYEHISALLIEAIKELNAKVTDLQNQLANK
jgi:hypothetical protein